MWDVINGRSPIHLLIFSKYLYFYYFLWNFPTYIFIQTRRLFGTLEYIQEIEILRWLFELPAR